MLEPQVRARIAALATDDENWEFVREVPVDEDPRKSLAEIGSEPKEKANSEDELRSGLLDGYALRLVSVDGKRYEYRSRESNQKLASQIETYSRLPKAGDPAERIHSTSADAQPEDLHGMGVIGSDDRVEIANPTPYPWAANGLGFLSNGSLWCTVIMVGSRTAISAAHCHYDRGTSSWHPVSLFRFGNDNGTQTTTTTSNWNVTIPTAFTTATTNWWYYDIAVIEFNADYGLLTGYHGVDMTPPTGSMAYNEYGYPSNVAKMGFVHGEQWGHNTSGTWGSSLMEPDPTYPDWLVHSTLDHTSGQSGGGVYDDVSGNRYWVTLVTVEWTANDCPGAATNCTSGPRLGSIWVPFIEEYSSYATTTSWGSYPRVP